MDLTEQCLARGYCLDSDLGVYVSRFDDLAVEAAAAADAAFAQGVDRGALQGIPIGVKDVISTADGPTSAQSVVLDPAWDNGRDAPAVARLRAVGAVIIGKTTTMEFAVGLPDPDKPFPIPRNPWDTSRWAGGSSSGSASGLTVGFFLGALGTDTGGSVRCPAAFCGVSGLKPTFGLVPKSGCIPLGYSLDVIGPMARSARGCAELLAVIAGFHASDPSAVDAPVSDCVASLNGSVAGLRLGIDRSIHLELDGADRMVAVCFDAALEALADAGAEIVELAIPHYRELTHSTILSWACEAFAYHRRNLQTRWNDYGAPTRIALASGALISGADYVQAQRVRRVGRAALLETLDTVDALLTPTAVRAAPHLESLDLASATASNLTRAWSAVGLPALSVPMGFTASGLPLGLQIVTRPLADAMALRIGDAYQQLTDWHRRLPEPSHQPSRARKGIRSGDLVRCSGRVARHHV